MDNIYFGNVCSRIRRYHSLIVRHNFVICNRFPYTDNLLKRNEYYMFTLGTIILKYKFKVTSTCQLSNRIII